MLCRIVTEDVCIEAHHKSSHVCSCASELYEHGFFTVPMQDTRCLDEDELGVVNRSHVLPDNLIYHLFNFLCVALKVIVHETPVDSELNLMARVLL
ncbi:hypothetical protein AVEN_31477-1 [Araneus ventricosus]|uniref:Uncharacterized protein n=1 Tax=Araneus ventricosus TaxID=182803 RepID=A0A4Y2W5J2_ARAVE|nr:hypothetical protein AVEN_31477-1 [Araneus ventricosus]